MNASSERSELVAVVALGSLDGVEDAVAVDAQRVVVLEREQEGERAEVLVGRNLGRAAVAIGDGRRLERAARLVEGPAKRADG